MVSKLEEETTASLSADVLNPYIHKLELTTLDKIKVLVMSVTVMPVRLVVMLGLLTLAWLFAKLGLSGLTPEQLYQRPLRGWRKDYLKPFIILLLRIMFGVGGWHWVPVRGRRASPREAPILAVAPHSSIFDVLPVILLGAPSVVAKAESQDTSLFGTLINYTQPVYVRRDDPQSRQNTIREILARCHPDNKEQWDQILIFPEGTCTNRSCLISFKPGAFYPKVPVQPVCIKYPNRLDTMSWTWEGPGALKLLWLSLCQLHNYCEIEYLPVYVPREREKADPRLYAANVRQTMARALQVPVSHLAYDDLAHIRWLETRGLPLHPPLIKLAKLHARLRRSQERVCTAEELSHRLNQDCCKLSLPQFCSFLGASETWESTRDFFDILDQPGQGQVDGRACLAGLQLLESDGDWPTRVHSALKVWGSSELGQEEFCSLAWLAMGLPLPHSSQLFSKLASSRKTSISSELAAGALLSGGGAPQLRPKLD